MSQLNIDFSPSDTPQAGAGYAVDSVFVIICFEIADISFPESGQIISIYRLAHECCRCQE